MHFVLKSESIYLGIDCKAGGSELKEEEKIQTWRPCQGDSMIPMWSPGITLTPLRLPLKKLIPFDSALRHPIDYDES